MILIIISFSIFLTSALHAENREKIIVGVVFSGDIPFYREIHEELIKRLIEKNYTGRVQFVIQRPNPDTLAWSNAVRKVIAYDASVIITYGSGATRAATYESYSIPIIYAGVYEPKRSGIKGKNIKGVGYRVPVSSIIRYLRKSKDIKTLGVLYSESEPSSETQYGDVRRICKTFSIDVVDIPARRAKEIGKSLNLLSYDSLFLTDSALVNKYFSDYVQIITEKGVPVVSILKGLEEYSLITLSADPREQGALLAKNLIEFINTGDINKIGNASLSKNSLTFNMKLAIELKLDIPIVLITESDRVIK